MNGLKKTTVQLVPPSFLISLFKTEDHSRSAEVTRLHTSSKTGERNCRQGQVGDPTKNRSDRVTILGSLCRGTKLFLSEQSCPVLVVPAQTQVSQLSDAQFSG